MTAGIETGSFNRLTWTPGGTIGQHTVASGVQTFLNTAYSARMRTAFEYDGSTISHCAVYVEDIRVKGEDANVSFTDNSPKSAWAKITIPKKRGKYDLSDPDKLMLEVVQEDDPEPENTEEMKVMYYLLYEKTGNVVVDWRHTHTICACSPEESSSSSSGSSSSGSSSYGSSSYGSSSYGSSSYGSSSYGSSSYGSSSYGSSSSGGSSSGGTSSGGTSSGGTSSGGTSSGGTSSGGTSSGGSSPKSSSGSNSDPKSGSHSQSHGSGSDDSQSYGEVEVVTGIRFEWACPTLTCYISKATVVRKDGAGSGGDGEETPVEVFTATPHSAEHVV